MKTRTIIRTLVLALCMATLIPAWSQKRIDKIADNLEKDKNCQVCFTERRSPKTKKLVTQTRTITSSSSKNLQKLLEAFEKERENSVKAVKNATCYVLKFSTGSVYTLTYSDSCFTLVISKGNDKNKDYSDASKSTKKERKKNKKKNKKNRRSSTSSSTVTSCTTSDDSGSVSITITDDSGEAIIEVDDAGVRINGLIIA